MSPPPPRLNRRQALAAGAASLGALALAACGESPADEVARSLPEGLRADGSWEQKALSAIVEDLYSHQQALACRVLRGEGASPSDMIESWIDSNRRPVERLSSLIGELRAGGAVDIARLAIASRHVRAMSAGASRA